MDAIEKTLFVWKKMVEEDLTKIQVYTKYGLKPDVSDCPLCQEVIDNTEETQPSCKECRMHEKWWTKGGEKRNTCLGDRHDGDPTYYRLFQITGDWKKKVYENLKRELDPDDKY